MPTEPPTVKPAGISYLAPTHHISYAAPDPHPHTAHICQSSLQTVQPLHDAWRKQHTMLPLLHSAPCTCKHTGTSWHIPCTCNLCMQVIVAKHAPHARTRSNTGHAFNDPSAFSIHVKRLLSPYKEGDDGWRSVHVDGCSLMDYRYKHARGQPVAVVHPVRAPCNFADMLRCLEVTLRVG